MNFLLLLHAFITLSLIGVILVQRSDGGGLGLGSSGGGGMGGMLSARGTSNLLTRITAVLAVLFMANCLLMTALSNRGVKQSRSVLNTERVEQEASPVEQTSESPPVEAPSTEQTSESPPVEPTPAAPSTEQTSEAPPVEPS